MYSNNCHLAMSQIVLRINDVPEQELMSAADANKDTVSSKDSCDRTGSSITSASAAALDARSN
jgi:hypothetical protein